ncbi:MAG: hypothetical protein IKE94_07375 [Aeriscardovia sp.]|nr:hypothetical protein [Aeriscardovia sp.]
MEINGKIYRNLEGQVEYLTSKWDDLQDQINDMVLTHFVVVDELPTEDIEKNAVYLVGPKGTAPDQYYEEWVYVETSEDTWNWEKLGYTTEVDLSGYLEKVIGTTTYSQLYAKHADGGQVMFDVTASAVANAVVKRTAGAQVDVPNTPTATTNATSKDYVDSNFLQKATGASTYGQAYVKAADGTQTRYDISVSAKAYSIPYRDADGRVRTKDPVNSEDAVNLSYANDHYLAKVTSTSSYFQAYCKNTDGSQTMCNANVGVVGGAIPLRRSNGNLAVPLIPTENGDAASKQYVDAVVGQLLYLHDIDLIITVDSTNKLFIKAYLVNGSPTAITTFDRILYKRIDIQWGAFGAHSYDAEAVAVTKLPSGFIHEDFEEPSVGFLYQYISGGNLISGKTDRSMSTTITDTVINF